MRKLIFFENQLLSFQKKLSKFLMFDLMKFVEKICEMSKIFKNIFEVYFILIKKFQNIFRVFSFVENFQKYFFLLF